MFDDPPIMLMAFALGVFVGYYFRDSVDWFLVRIRNGR